MTSPFAPMIKLLASLAPEDGSVDCAIPFMTVTRYAQPTPFSPGMLQPSVCLVLQGRKECWIGKDVFGYGPGDCIAVSLDMPISGRVVEAFPDRPYLSVHVAFDPGELAMQVMEMRDLLPPGGTARGAMVGSSDQPLREAIFRLLHLNAEPKDIPFLAPLLRKEIIYHLLVSEHGAQLSRSLFLGDRTGISRAVARLKRDFATPLTVAELAREAGMSVSEFHRRFKVATTLAPLQFQKRLRLLEARRLLFTGQANAGGAGFAVGYESASQFSREYRGLFGAPPRKDLEGLAQDPANLAQDPDIA
jgi:AraC-like DNA-binding protein